MGIVTEKSLENMFQEKQIQESDREIARAILCGQKCGLLEVNIIGDKTNSLVDEFVIYYGQTMSEPQIKQLKAILPFEFKKYYASLTVQELVTGTQLAMRDRFGEVKYQKVSIKLLTELVIKYTNSDLRKRIIYAAKQAMAESEVELKHISQEQKDKYVMNAICDGYLKWKEEGINGFHVSFIHYDFLFQKGVVVLDYSQHLKAAAELIKKRKGNQTTIAEEFSKIHGRNITTEAKRMAMVELFNQLKVSGKDLREYINSTKKQTA